MSDDIVDRLRWHYKVECRRCHHFNSDMSAVREVTLAAADEIVRLRERVTELEAENLRVRRYAEEMDGLAERRLMSTNAERALADQLAEALRQWVTAEAGDIIEWGIARLDDDPDEPRTSPALAAYDRARNPETP